ncbi:MAG: hypothetical protein WCP39_00205 [Chlamydiota bacterium]
MTHKIDNNPPEKFDKDSNDDISSFDAISPIKDFPSKDKKVNEKEEGKKKTLSPLDLPYRKKGSKKTDMSTRKIGKSDSFDKETLDPSFQEFLKIFSLNQKMISGNPSMELKKLIAPSLQELLLALMQALKKAPSLDKLPPSLFQTLQSALDTLQNLLPSLPADSSDITKKTILTLSSGYQDILENQKSPIPPLAWQNIENFFLFLASNKDVSLSAAEEQSLASLMNAIEKKISSLPKKMEKNFAAVLQKMGTFPSFSHLKPQLQNLRHSIFTTTKTIEKTPIKKDEVSKISPQELRSPYETFIPHKMDITPPAYLSPKINVLFDHMVGLLSYSKNIGISETEVILNSPSFKNSVFYQAKIFIIRHDTAPDSFNIRLTGSPEAVDLFNSNMPQLASAFRESFLSGDVSFQIGRLSAEQTTTEKPIFHRKEKVQDQEKDNPNG